MMAKALPGLLEEYDIPGLERPENTMPRAAAAGHTGQIRRLLSMLEQWNITRLGKMTEESGFERAENGWRALTMTSSWTISG